MSAVQSYKKIENEIKAQQRLFSNNEKRSALAELLRCEIHLNKLSNNCRQCKKLRETQQQLEEPEEAPKQIELVNRFPTETNVFPTQGTPAQGLNAMLRQNIVNCSYFRDMVVRSYHDVIAEIERASNNAEPWAVGGQGVPSTLFCCLYKLMTMNLSCNQVRGLLDYYGNAYVRCCGLLYVRYACDPIYLWAWLRKSIMDDDEFNPAVDKSISMTLGEYVEKLLTDQQYFGTRLPRIPMAIENKIQAKIVLTREKRQRRLINQRLVDQFYPGVKIRAVSSMTDEWHFGIVEWFEGKSLSVRFDGDGNSHEYVLAVFQGGSEVVNLGEVELLAQDDEGQDRLAQLVASRFEEGGSPSPSQNQVRQKSRSRSRSPQKKFETNKEKADRLEHEIRQKQRNKALADNKSEVARIPSSYKSALSGSLPTTTQLKARQNSPLHETHYVKINIPQQQVQQSVQQAAPELAPQDLEFRRQLQKKYVDNTDVGKLNQDYI